MTDTIDKETFDEIFDLFDQNKNGTISKDEVISLLQGLGMNPPDSSIDDIIKEIDINKSGGVDRDELFDWYKKRRPVYDVDESALQNAFKMFDKNGDGYIMLEELKKMFEKMGQSMSDEEVKDMINELDHNNDGRIDIDEFTKFLSRPINMQKPKK